MPVRPKMLAVALLGLTYLVGHRAGQLAGFNLATRRFIRLAREVEQGAGDE